MSTPESSPEETSSVTPHANAASSNSDDNSKPKPTNGECLASSSSSTTRIFLRPSALAAQTEKLKLMKPEEKCPKLHESCTRSEASSSNVSEQAEHPPPQPPPPPPQATVTSTAPQLFAPRDKPAAQFPDLFAASSSAVGQNIISSGSFKALVPDAGEVGKEDGDGFVFGCNLHDRALNYESPTRLKNEQLASTEQNASNCSLTFENAADLKDEKNCNDKKQPEKTLSEFAKEYEMKRPQVKFEEVDVITGEEGESNVLQMNCKLFVFDKTKLNWQEKGRGFLRLNDREDAGVLHSRLIMRVQGSLKVMLNAKVWSAMKLKRQSQKTIQFSAVDSDEGVKVYLVIAGISEIEQLFSALDCRIANLKHQETVSSSKTTTVVTSSEKTENISVPALDTSSNDSFESPPQKRFKPMHPEDGSADSSTENITTEGTYDASSENSTDSTDGIKPYDAAATATTKPQETA